MVLRRRREPRQYQCIVAVYTFQQIIEMSEGRHMHKVGSFATLDCVCKSKSHILCNVALRNLAQRRIETTRFGIQAIGLMHRHLGLHSKVGSNCLTTAILVVLLLAHILKSLILPLPRKCLTGLSLSADPPFLLWHVVRDITPLS